MHPKGVQVRRTQTAQKTVWVLLPYRQASTKSNPGKETLVNLGSRPDSYTLGQPIGNLLEPAGILLRPPVPPL